MTIKEEWLGKALAVLATLLLSIIAWWVSDIHTKVQQLVEAQHHNEEFHDWNHPPGPQE